MVRLIIHTLPPLRPRTTGTTEIPVSQSPSSLSPACSRDYSRLRAKTTTNDPAAGITRPFGATLTFGHRLETVSNRDRKHRREWPNGSGSAMTTMAVVGRPRTTRGVSGPDDDRDLDRDRELVRSSHLVLASSQRASRGSRISCLF
jgi:hypothetical protein